MSEECLRNLAELYRGELNESVERFRNEMNNIAQEFKTEFKTKMGRVPDRNEVNSFFRKCRDNTANAIRTATFAIMSAKVYETHDVLGKGDPFVVVKLGSAERKTHTVDNTQTPVWNTILRFHNINENDAEDVTITLYDEDASTVELIGTAHISVVASKHIRTHLSVTVCDASGRMQGEVELEVLLSGSSEADRELADALAFDMIFNAPPPQNNEEKNQVVILIKSGKVYEQQGLLAKGDSYVLVRVASTEKCTERVSGTFEPQWNSKLTFNNISPSALDDSAPLILTLIVKVGTTETYIGTGSLGLAPFRDREESATVALYNREGMEQGTVEVLAVVMKAEEEEEV